jgi:AcrR family transcriptional regulator
MITRMTLRERRASETRHLILDAAYRLFSRYGYGQTSVDAILGEAGLSKGAFYHHFVSKEELFKVLLEDRQRRCMEQMASAVSPASSTRDAIERLVAVALGFDEGDPDWVRVYFEFCIQAMRDGFARDITARSLNECRMIVAEMLKDGQERGVVRADLDAAAATFLLIGIFDGVALHRAIDPDAANPSALADSTADLIEKFIQKEVCDG